MYRHPQTLAELRADLPITRNFVYLQTGSYAPVPVSTQEYMASLQREESEHVLAAGGKGSTSDFHHQAERARQTLAALLGVTPAEFAWTYNTTTATRLAIRSICWQAGDRLAISDVEHASTVDLALGMQQAMGVATTVIPTDFDGSYAPDYFLEQLDHLLTPEHRLLILCHVANTDGRRLPVAQAVRLARTRGVKILIDGAQAVGVFPIDVGAVDADFYSGSLHKWLMGPAGVGFLVVNAAQLDAYNPNLLPLPHGDEPRLTAGALSELGTANHVLRMGAAFSVATLQQIGLERIEDQMRRLTQRLRGGLHHISGIRQLGPAQWEDSSSITTIQMAESTLEKCQRLAAALRERYSIVSKVRPEVLGVRISVAAFNTEQEIDLLLEALATLQVI